MGKIINLSAVLEKEEKLQQVVDYMEELKDQFSYLIQEYEDDGADVRKVDTLTEALDALEDAGPIEMGDEIGRFPAVVFIDEGIRYIVEVIRRRIPK